MPIPWLTILDALVGTVARRTGRTQMSAVGGGLEARLAGAAVGAIREVFDEGSITGLFDHVGV